MAIAAGRKLKPAGVNSESGRLEDGNYFEIFKWIEYGMAGLTLRGASPR
jgi:hypothetical protein